MQVIPSQTREKFPLTLTMVVSLAGWWQQNLSRKLIHVSLLSQATSDRMGGQGLMLSHRRFRLDIWKNVFMEVIFKNWNRLPKELVEPPSLKVLKNMRHLRTWFSDECGGAAVLMVGFDDLKALFQPKQSCHFTLNVLSLLKICSSVLTLSCDYKGSGRKNSKSPISTNNWGRMHFLCLQSNSWSLTQVLNHIHPCTTCFTHKFLHQIFLEHFHHTTHCSLNHWPFQGRILLTAQFSITVFLFSFNLAQKFHSNFRNIHFFSNMHLLLEEREKGRRTASTLWNLSPMQIWNDIKFGDINDEIRIKIWIRYSCHDKDKNSTLGIFQASSLG